MLTDRIPEHIYLVAAALQCGTGLRAGLAMLDSDGDLVTTFGDQGRLVLAGSSGADFRPVALEPRRGSVLGLSSVVAWLGGTVGVGEGSQFGLARLTATGQDAVFGWKQTTFPEAEEAIAFDLEIDSVGRPVLGGMAIAGNVRYGSLARFKHTNGMLDTNFGDGGLVGERIGGRDTAIIALDSRNNEIAAAVEIFHENATPLSSLGAAKFSSNGSRVWGHDTIQSGGSWRHARPGGGLDYGSYLEAGNQAVPAEVAVDQEGRFLVVGRVASDFELNEFYPSKDRIAVARYLPFGEPDSRRWVPPGKTLRFIVPEDRTFPEPAPALVRIELDFQGGDAVDWEIERGAEPLMGNSVPGQGYLFPLAGFDADEAALVKGHPLTHHHRHSSGNRFAHDIGLRRWTGSTWTRLADGATVLATNEDYLDWNWPVLAMADGEVVACRRSSADQAPDTSNGEDANVVVIQHSFHALDKSRREFASYVHLRQDSIPLEICPYICPEDDPGCDVETEGVDPDGRELPTPIPVVAGQFLGNIGNTGVSSNPHLHVHLSTGAGGGEGDPVAGNIPLLFREVMIGSSVDGAGVEIEPDWYSIENLALPHGYLVVPDNP